MKRYSKLYIETVEQCSKCGIKSPKGFVQTTNGYTSCICRQSYLWLKKLHDSGLPKSYWNESVREFKGDPEALKAVQNYIKTLDRNLVTGLGLYLWGSNGIGKTLLASFILKSALLKKKSAYFYYYSDILNVFSDSWKDDSAKEEIEQNIINGDLLVIDDLGREFRGKTNFNIASFDTVLRKRIGNLKPVILTSNLDRLDIRDQYGKEIIDLFKESLTEIQVTGESYRSNKREEKS